MDDFTLTRRDALISLGVCLVVFLLHHASPVLTVSDSLWNIHAAMSIVKEGNTDLDEYAGILAAEGRYAVVSRGGHEYNYFPVGTSLAALPAVWFFEKLSGGALSRELKEGAYSVLRLKTEKFIASLFVALTSAMVYLLAAGRLDGGRSLVLVFVFAFCTSSWSTASRALWSHSPSMLLLSAALLLVLLSGRSPALAQFASLPLALAFVTRPTNALSVLFLSAWILLAKRKYFGRFLLWSLPVAFPFVLYSLMVFQDPLPPYFQPARLGVTGRAFTGALLGTLFSPGRGLFIYSPVLLLSLWGLVRGLGTSARSLYLVLFLICLSHWLVISGFPLWYGGHCYGPRLFTDLLPFLIFLMVPLAAAAPPPSKAAPLMALFVLLSTASFLVHWRGATSMAVHRWNVEPVPVEDDPSRIWRWEDVQFLRKD